MTWSDFIGFLVSLAVFLFLMFRHAFKEKHEPEEEIEEELFFPPPPPIPNSRKAIISSHFDDLSKSTTYIVEGKERSSRSHRILSELKSKKDMVIFKEIIGPPKGL